MRKSALARAIVQKLTDDEVWDIAPVNRGQKLVQRQNWGRTSAAGHIATYMTKPRLEEWYGKLYGEQPEQGDLTKMQMATAIARAMPPGYRALHYPRRGPNRPTDHEEITIEMVAKYLSNKYTKEGLRHRYEDMQAEASNAAGKGV